MNSTDLEGYQALKDENLPTLKSEAQYGTERLQAAYVTIPKGNSKRHLWEVHSISLKEIAQFADQVLQHQGETYEHSPA